MAYGQDKEVRGEEEEVCEDYEVEGDFKGEEDREEEGEGDEEEHCAGLLVVFRRVVMTIGRSVGRSEVE